MRRMIAKTETETGNAKESVRENVNVRKTATENERKKKTKTKIEIAMIIKTSAEDVRKAKRLLEIKNQAPEAALKAIKDTITKIKQSLGPVLLRNLFPKTIKRLIQDLIPKGRIETG